MLDEAIILETCRRHAGGDFHAGDAVPAEMLRNARYDFRIPREERVLALFDNTVLRSGREGLAFCATGLYWENPPGCVSAGNHLPWEELAPAVIDDEPGTRTIRLGGGRAVHVMNHGARAVVMKALYALQGAARVEVAAAARRAPSKGEIPGAGA